MPTSPRLPLYIYAHGDLALSLEANPDHPSPIVAGEGMPWLSSQWEGDEGSAQVIRWLECALPENGNLQRWWNRATEELSRFDELIQILLPQTLLWAHADAEYPGALSVSRGHPRPPIKPIPISDYQTLDSNDLQALIEDAIVAGGSVRWGAGKRLVSPRASSLSGMRPKISVSGEPGAWLLAPTGHLNTLIVKVEDSHGNPAEAGIESICQQTLRQLGIRAAQTKSRLIGDSQCIISTRCDRKIENGVAVPIHQEDLRQTGGYTTEKYLPTPADEGKGWIRAYAALKDRALDPLAESNRLTELIAAAWMLGHGDFHRGNLGFQVSSPSDGKPKRVSLAPAYDASSAAGTKYSKNMVMGVGRQKDASKVKLGAWREHARFYGLDEDATLSIVSKVAENISDAFSDACRICAEQDENRAQHALSERIAKTAGYVRARVGTIKAGRRKTAERMPRPAGADPPP